MAPVFPVDVDWLAEEASALDGPGTPSCALVVGGSGLLGSNLTVLLSRAPRCKCVRVLDMSTPSADMYTAVPHLEFVQHRLGSDEVEDDKVLLSAMAGVDCVFSVVTPHVQHASAADFYATNEVGVKRLVGACLKKGISRLVHLSSIAVTSHFIESVEQTETHPLPSPERYESPYDISKFRGESAVLQANQRDVLATCSLRAGGIFMSPWDFALANFWPIVPGLIIQPRGEPIDFIDGRDVCCAMLLAAQKLQEQPEKVAGEVFFVSKGEAHPPGECARMGAKLLGLPFIHVPDLVIHFAFVLIWLHDMCREMIGLENSGIPPHRFLKMLFTQKT